MSAAVERGAKAVTLAATVVLCLVIGGTIDPGWLWLAVGLEVFAALGLAGDR